MTAEERDVVRGYNKWKGSVAGLGGLSWLVGFFFLKKIVVVCTHCAFLE